VSREKSALASIKASTHAVVRWAFPVLLPIGLGVYALTGKTPLPVYAGFRKYFCLTDGYLNDVLSSIVTVTRGTYQFPDTTGVLGELSGDRIAEIVSKIDRDGFYVFEQKLDEDVCERILQFALGRKCSPRFEDGHGEPTLIDRGTPVASLYDYSEETILESPDVCKLLTDFSILAVAQKYLRSKPVCDLVAMWWSTNFSRTPSNAGAQLYHFDMDRLKFLKFFINITDVSSDQGPHCYVKGSHRRKPKALRIDRRLSDQEIGSFYEPDDFVEFCGKRGTIVAEDTRGFHKGKVPSGDRLMLQLEFANSLFGMTYNRLAVPPSVDRKVLDYYQHSFRRFHR
jgi:Phytanoyl-CoA dioxygenase (PhyH)